jgi:hypothetical protein
MIGELEKAIDALPPHADAEPYIESVLASLREGPPAQAETVDACRAKRFNANTTGERMDCGYPFCGCIPEADRAIQAVTDCGWHAPEECGETIASLEALCASLKAALRRIEWEGALGYGDTGCAECQHDASRGHTEHCSIRSALSTPGGTP